MRVDDGATATVDAEGVEAGVALGTAAVAAAERDAETGTVGGDDEGVAFRGGGGGGDSAGDSESVGGIAATVEEEASNELTIGVAAAETATATVVAS